MIQDHLFSVIVCWQLYFTLFKIFSSGQQHNLHQKTLKKKYFASFQTPINKPLMTDYCAKNVIV